MIESWSCFEWMLSTERERGRRNEIENNKRTDSPNANEPTKNDQAGWMASAVSKKKRPGCVVTFDGDALQGQMSNELSAAKSD